MKILKCKNGDLVKVCDRDYELLKYCSITIQKNKDTEAKYARIRKTKNKRDCGIILHKLIMGKPPKGLVIDHINQNTLDNRRCNLRFATKQINAINSNKKQKSISGYRGVYFDKRNKSKTYDAYITVNRKRIWLRGFKTAEEAAKARDELFKKHFGIYDGLNFK